MMYCFKHDHWFQEPRCDMCLNHEPGALRVRDDVADPYDWKICLRNGWVKG